MIPAFFGLAGPALGEAERAFFRSVEPAGFILFRRNCTDRAQMKALTDELRSLSGRDDVPILIDQEGGRVQRMGPPEWPKLPAAEPFARLYEKAPVSAMEAARLNAKAIATMLREVGVNVDCLPLLDVRRPDADAIIGDRALGSDPMQVAALGRLVIDGLREGGVVGVVKHMPGHGRAMADSHKELPVVEAPEAELAEDVAPFVGLRDAAMGMTAHVVYTAWDKERCASLSPVVIGEIIRGRIGFDGLLMSDDLGMHALSGGFAERAAGVIAAGCDIALHCSGDMAEMEAVAGALGPIAAVSHDRLQRAMATVAAQAPFESFEELAARRDSLLALA
ncbi:beta-N-acetylhexosaminidase [Sphingomonas oligoaromativorans]|uniref:beta-N-acetylhexosaminidase n=1 Tax=Sphingomonas oligoaromativorans TaxID=575322 RepID=UPI00141F2DD8|nr:beta-N-acetylhexosaminidase [Sphingomonas oligoaromativorans]NIJ33829.1 beta-N-acetylhexosaminidase [Sphingomonas oligoaromativorans]